MSTELEENFASVLATVLVMIAYFTKSIRRGRLRELIARFLMGEDQKLKSLQQDLDQYVKHGAELVLIEIKNSMNCIGDQTTKTSAQVEDIGHRTKKIDVSVENVKDNTLAIMDLIQQQHHSKRDDDLYDILKPTQSPENKLASIQRTRVSGTGDWLQSEPLFQRWLRQDESLLWIAGNPGSGKTFLATAVVSSLLNEAARRNGSGHDTSVGFFFFDKTGPYNRVGGFHQALKDVAWQISRVNTDYADHISSQCRSWADVDTTHSAWRKLFTSYFGSPGRPLYLILDGIDETDETGDHGREEFLSLLPDLTGKFDDSMSSHPQISLLMLGRPHLTNSIKLAAYGKRATMATIHIEAQKNKADLSKFIDRGIKKLSLDESYRNLQQRIRDTIEAKAEGMFLWAKLMFDILSRQRNEEQIIECLDEAPLGIKKMIDEVLKVFSSTLKGSEPEELNLILAWLACATRPLKLAELDAVLMRMSKSGKRVFSLEKRLREDFASLIVLVRDDGLSTGALQSQSQALSTNKTANVFNSIPATTNVMFSHASIAEYFQSGNGKFSQRPYLPAIGVVTSEAQLAVLQTCLEIFVDPGEEGRLEAAQLLQTYAAQNWFYHLEKASVFLGEVSEEDQLQIVKLLVPLLSQQPILRSWCEEIPWSFFTPKSAGTIASWANFTDIHGKEVQDATIDAWITTCKSKPVEIFLPAASVHAKEALHGHDWTSVESLRVIAQIRALVLDDRTLDLQPDPMPIETMMEAADWDGLEQTANWHRKLAVGLRNCGYINEAVENFEIALHMDRNLISARHGLAVLYDDTGYHTKAINLQLENISLLLEQDMAEKEHDKKVRLCTTYRFIARIYEKKKDTERALEFWRQTFDTGVMEDPWIFQYVKALARTPNESRWGSIVSILKTLEERPGPNGSGSYLSHCLMKEIWPELCMPARFYIFATAAKKTGQTAWLDQAYQTAIAASNSHLTTIVLKVALTVLRKRFGGRYDETAPLLEEIAETCILAQAAKIEDLDRCKRTIGNDFGLLCVRKVAEHGLNHKVTEHFRKMLTAFCDSGVPPLDLPTKVRYAEFTPVYLAYSQRLSGNTQSARDIIKPYVAESYQLETEGEPVRRGIGLLWFVMIYLALGRDDDAASLFCFAHSLEVWCCSECGKRTFDREGACICRYCFFVFCSDCLVRRTDPTLCVASHSLIDIGLRSVISKEGEILFRNKPAQVEQCLEIIRKEWGFN
ncbi:hypothetical protein K505DRAFT_281236 [Melanomma pulvis-pyrius CBS 109.77]|uniref:Nephrocystin 3-like N-terminal domain-containing protein n=1 Tax=Melanomma pulvis-pyrius CBS 109.77 TaxID=1314802 RepID=A0A6A6X4M6_9PLEO|nr:hypothetical protein K505DRAFT_281236 [Melanomma pulvis-pyrius CBS 109.77]